MFLTVAFPAIDPILLQIGPLAIRWYSLAYIFGFVFAWWYARLLLEKPRVWAKNTAPFSPLKIDDALVYAALAGILGGRFFYVFVYNFKIYAQDPLAVFRVWEGGMAFHGGIIGVMLGLLFFARQQKIAAFALFDLAACVAPIGIMLGRLANFINGELWGRVSDAPWSMVFPTGGDLPRHPSQLYQAFGEGLLLFILLNLIAWRGGLKHQGQMAGLFGIGYGIARFIGEFWREPDPQLGFLWGGASMGQLLSLPIILLGVFFVVRARRA
jgi:phosphatidylglycerol---prolipoprotein diacylglyceryl transferase